MRVIARAFMRYHYLAAGQVHADMHAPEHALMLVPMRRFQHHIAARQTLCTEREMLGFVANARF